MDNIRTSVVFWGNLFDIIGGSTGKVFHAGAFAVEIGENNDFLFIVLTQILGNHHICVGVAVVQLDNELIASEGIGYFSLKGTTCKS